MNCIVLSGLSDRKLKSKLLPLVHTKSIDKIYLIRRKPIELEKAICYCPPLWARNITLFCEIYRFWTAIFLTWSKKPDVIIGIYFYMHCLYAAMVGWLFRIPFIMLIVEDPKTNYKNSKLFLTVIKKASAVGVRGTFTRDYLIEQGIESEKVFIPHNIFTFEEKQRCAKEFDLIYVADFVKEKSPEVLMEVLKQIHNQGIGFKCALLGDGPLMSKMKDFVQTQGLGEKVMFKGYQLNVREYLMKSKTLILTSKTEGLPMVVIEAMSCGLPCVVPDIGNMRDVAQDGINSLIVKPHDIGQMVEAVSKLLTDQELYEKLSENAFRIADEKKEDYSLESVSDVWNDVFTGERLCAASQVN